MDDDHADSSTSNNGDLVNEMRSTGISRDAQDGKIYKLEIPVEKGGSYGAALVRAVNEGTAWVNQRDDLRVIYCNVTGYVVTIQAQQMAPEKPIERIVEIHEATSDNRLQVDIPSHAPVKVTAPINPNQPVPSANVANQEVHQAESVSKSQADLVYPKNVQLF